MKRTTMILLIGVCLLIAPTAAAKQPGLAGTWVGGYETDGRWVFIETRFWQAGDGFQGRIDFGADTRRWQLVSDISLDSDGSLHITVDDLIFSGRIDGTGISGDRGRFNLRRTFDLPIGSYKPFIGNYAPEEGPVLMLLSNQDEGKFLYHDTATRRQVEIYPLSEAVFFSELGEELTLVNDHEIRLTHRDGGTLQAQRVFPYGEEDVRYPHGEISLAGTLLLPDGEGPFPAIVLMHSTGPNNRDYFRQWGHYFADAGIAALVYDKPGAYDSAHPSLPSFRYNSLQDLADAALAGVGYLQTRPEVNPEQIGLWTYSNSSWAGPIAAAQSDQVAFLIATAVSGVAGRQADPFQEDLNNYRHYDYPEWAAASSLGYLKFTREFALMANEWRLPIGATLRDYWGLDFDPLTAWRNVTQPVLLLNGERDTLVDPVDAVARIQATLEEAGHSDYTLVVVPGADHRLQLSETGLIDESRGSHDLVFAPGVMDTMTTWVLARFNGAGTTPQISRNVTSPVPVNISQHFEDGGPYALLPWYGQPEIQAPLMLLFLLVPLGIVLGWPVMGIIRRARGKASPEPLPLARPGLWVMAFLMLLVMAGMIMTWVQIVHLYVGELWGLPGYLKLVPVLGYLSIPAVLAAVYFASQSWRRSPASRLADGLLAVLGLAYIWFIAFWQIIG